MEFDMKKELQQTRHGWGPAVESSTNFVQCRRGPLLYEIDCWSSGPNKSP